MLFAVTSVPLPRRADAILPLTTRLVTRPVFPAHALTRAASPLTCPGLVTGSVRRSAGLSAVAVTVTTDGLAMRAEAAETAVGRVPAAAVEAVAVPVLIAFLKTFAAVERPLGAEGVSARVVEAFAFIVAAHYPRLRAGGGAGAAEGRAGCGADAGASVLVVDTVATVKVAACAADATITLGGASFG
ncbi:MAG: hypothetical protein Q9160_000169 [Pyrenula sp. 1 TL-2023]